MAGLPWILVFALLALVATWRGWGTTFTVAVLFVGMGMADTSVGASLYSGGQGVMTGLWTGVTTAAQAMLQ